MVRTSPTPGQHGAVERTALVGLAQGAPKRDAAERSLEELAGLARAAGAEVALRLVQDKARPDPATCLGAGKVEWLAAAAAEHDVSVVIFDHELTPAQARNLEHALSCRVIDRTQLILDIFARRARTREGKLQVELAQLKYLLPRLVGAGAELSRLGGGIGTRGPGETQLETDRRKIRQRIATLQRDIGGVRQRRQQLRERRRRSEMPTIALVGYTNAGKTTIFNLLAGQQSVVSDALFVTLDPLVRQIRLADRRSALLSDTVGFIDRLPHTLVAAFRATLEEVAEADLLLHVVDASSGERERHVRAVTTVLEEVGAIDVPAVLVWNKVDLLDAVDRERLARVAPGAQLFSARTREGREELLAVVAARLGLDTARVRLEFDAASADDRARIARLYREARVVSHEAARGRVTVEADVPRRFLDRLAPAAGSRP
jgi:GTPase